MKKMKIVVSMGTTSPQKVKESLAELMAIYKEDIYIDVDSDEFFIKDKPSIQFDKKKENNEKFEHI